MIRLIKIVILVLCLPFIIFGQSGDYNKVGTTAAQFLKVEVGARALAMGGCFGALANDATALYWNPAGIAQLKNMEISLTHTQWIAGISNGFAGFVIPLDETNIFGLSFAYQTMGEMEQTTIEQPKGTGLYFDAQDIAIGISYARPMTEYILFGLTAKMVHQSIWNETAMGFAVDMGLLLDTGIRGTKVAMVMTNFGTDMQFDGRDLIRGYDQLPGSASNPDTEAKLSTEGWPLPTNLRLSVTNEIMGSVESFFPNADNRVTVIADLTHPNDNPEHYNIGIEYGLYDSYFIRTGYRGNTDEEGITLGAGINFEIAENARLLVDYAYADFGIFDYVQHFSIGIKF
jgi:hypothetical protein